MAEYAGKPSRPATPDDPFPDLTDEANSRLDAARKQKREWDSDIREGYAFAAPHRAREIRSEQAQSTSKPGDEALLQTAAAFELSKDFATVVLNSFMPVAEPWAERRPGMFVPEEAAGQIKEKVAKADGKIFEAIRASNLYEEIPKSWNPDLSSGTAAIWVHDPRPAENVVVQAVPLHELEINVGPFGDLDDRFVVRHTKNRHVKAVLGEQIYGTLAETVRATIERAHDESTIVAWGFWRLWERRDDVVWQHVVMLGNKVVHRAELVGEGSCGLIPMRWNPSPEWAYAAGPLIESLPDLRQLDDIQAKKIEHIDLTLAPPTFIPSDSFVQLEHGIEPGKAYACRPGDEGAVKRIFEPGTMEAAIFETKEIERALRHRFYLDWPEQRGDTPPTATQWIDEMTIAQRRLGTPGMSFWKEGPAQIFLRFKYLLEKQGLIEPVRVNGKTVSLQPYNPAQRAAEQQEVAMTARFLQIVAPTWPEEFRLKIDGGKTMQNVAQKMRVTLVAFREEDQQKAALDQISQLIEGRQQIRPASAEIVGPQ